MMKIGDTVLRRMPSYTHELPHPVVVVGFSYVPAQRNQSHKGHWVRVFDPLFAKNPKPKSLTKSQRRKQNTYSVMATDIVKVSR